jgi:hypothetical protein
MPKLVLQTGVLGTLDVPTDELRLTVDESRYYTETEVNTALAGKSNTGHGHAIADVTSLQTTLDGKAASSHTQAISTITGLQTTLDGKAASSHNHDTLYYTEAEIDAKTAKTRQTLVESAGTYPAKDAKFGYADYFGPTDPATLGITLGANDTWNDTDAIASADVMTLAALSATTTVTGTAFQNVAGLFIPVTAGVKYAFEVITNFDVSDATSGTKWALNGPAFSEFSMRGVTAQAFAVLVNTFTGSYDSGNVSTASLSTGNTAIMMGTIIPSASGNLQVRAGSELAGNTITVRPGSMMKLIRLP